MKKKSLNTTKIKSFKLNYQKTIKKLKEYAEKHIKEKKAKTIILIRSLARGDYTAYSDADIIIISDNVPKRPIDRITEYIDPTLPIDIQLIVYTTQEITKMAKQKRKIIKEIITHGKILAGNKQIINKLKQLTQQQNHTNKNKKQTT
ncbi:MAG: nucleotidyltransferase domain-containing protein [archaeon GB-1867-005]|nr:nucleotidyltransferase domain-containing protein [Candidatus Culexmicrobium cathedralense]